MNFHNASVPGTQGKNPGDTFPVTPQYITRRIEREEADGGGELVELGLSRTDIARLSASRMNCQSSWWTVFQRPIAGT
jgi:hypothetical protein